MFKKTFFIILLSFLFISPVFAYSFDEASGLKTTAQEAGYDMGNERDVERTIANTINIVLGLVGVLFIGLMLYGGYNWMTAGGNEEKVKKAKGTVTEAAIGFIVVIAAYAISYFVLDFVIDLSLSE